MKARLITEGYEELEKKLKDVGVNVESVVKKALLRGGQVTQQRINEEGSRFRRTGQMESAQITPKLEAVGYGQWRVRVGYDKSKEGGIHAIILNYGSPRKVKRMRRHSIATWHFITNAIRNTRRDRQEMFMMVSDEILRELDK